MRDLTNHEVEAVGGGQMNFDAINFMNNWLNGQPEVEGGAAGFDGSQVQWQYDQVHVTNDTHGLFIELNYWGDRGNNGSVDIGFSVAPNGNVYADMNNDGSAETLIGNHQQD